MDGDFPGLPVPASRTVLQRFLVGCPVSRRCLYWRDSAANAGGRPSVSEAAGGGLCVRHGATLQFDTYFNAFFEAQWLRHTALRSLAVELTLTGTATLRVCRHVSNKTLAVSEAMIGPGVSRTAIAFETINFRQHGALSVELTATDGDVIVRSGAWTTEDTPQHRVNLAAVFCTFNREAEIARAVASIGADAAVCAHLARVFVINQGRPGLVRWPAFADAADMLHDRLSVIEQANFGGAGGFSRGLLAALDDPSLTHAVLLDDDLELEPDSLLRMAAFFAFCERPLVLGGHMLDALHPTMLYEAGAVITERDWTFLPQHFQRSIGSAEALGEMSQPYAVHYNGWWCCGFPLSIVREHGMPLPCFIRGDDTEFGLRLHERGVPTVPMPGIAVWHEPFYLKLGGWQLYYETRNLLVAMALHRSTSQWDVVARFGREVVNHLLTYRYYSTALILAGIEAYLAGPQAMLEPPLPRHRGLSVLKAAYPDAETSREIVIPDQALRAAPWGRVRRVALLAWLLGRNAVMPSSEGPVRRLPIEELHWLFVRQAGHIATDSWWNDGLPTYRRTREHHRALLLKAARLLVRLYRELPAVAATWRAAAPSLTSVRSWKAYLGRSDPAREPAVQLQAVAVQAMDLKAGAVAGD